VAPGGWMRERQEQDRDGDGQGTAQHVGILPRPLAAPSSVRRARA
jgi:hypothetical protein